MTKTTDDKSPDNPEDNVVAIGGNIGPLKKDILAAVTEINRLRETRKGVNEEIAAIRSDLEAQGIPRKAFDRVLADFNLDPKQREAVDLAYQIAREAVSLPIQGDLFKQASD